MGKLLARAICWRDPLQKAWRIVAVPTILLMLLALGAIDTRPLSRPVSANEGDGVALAQLDAARRNGCTEPTSTILTKRPPKDCRPAFKDVDIVIFGDPGWIIGSPRHVRAFKRLPAQWPLEETWVALALNPRDEHADGTAYDLSWTACPLVRLTARDLMRYAPKPGGQDGGPIRVGHPYADGGWDTMLVRAGASDHRREQEVDFFDSTTRARLWNRLAPCRKRTV